MKIAFLDRDGTIVRDYPDETWRLIKEPEFLNGAIEGLKKLSLQGYKLIIVTNQYLINENIITEKQYYSFTNKMINVINKNGIELLDVFYCPHSSGENCECFKPKPGLINQALMKYCEIDLNDSIYVGDSTCDLELANILGISFYGIEGGSISKSIKVYKSIKEIVDIL